MSESVTLLDRVLYWERTSPDRIWLTQPLGGGRLQTWTWKQAVDEARRMASYLAALGLPAGSSIALCSKNTAWWIMADVAVWMAGHVSVPLYSVVAPDTVRHVLEHSGARLLLVGKLDPVWEEMKRGVPAGLPTITMPLGPVGEGPHWEDIVAAEAPLATPAVRAPDDLATIIYTSGSTGKPKGAMLSFGIMHTAGRNLAELFEVTPDDRALSYLPLAHAYERTFTESINLYAGSRLFFAETLDTFLVDLQRARPTTFISVPQLWLKFQAGVFEKVPPAKLERLLHIPVVSSLVKKKILRQLGLDQVRVAGSGSAPIPKEVIVWYRRLGLDLSEGYGMTENFAYSHVTRPGEGRPGYVGTTVPGVECRLTDEGEILVKSPCTMLGYYRDPALTAEMLTPDGFLRTGDLGSVDEQGRLMVTGRVKEIFKTAKGKYIAPAPLENRVLKHPLVEQCCVAGAGLAQPYALVVLTEDARRRAMGGGRSDVTEQLREHLDGINRDLPRYEQLELIAVVEDVWLPENGFLTPTFKVKRARIEAAYGPLAQGWYDAGQPVVWQSPREVTGAGVAAGAAAPSTAAAEARPS